MRNIILLSIVSLFGACATYIDVNVMKPAQVDLGDTKNLAVLDFEFKGRWQFDEKKPSENLLDLTKEAIKKTLDIQDSIQVMPDPKKAFPGTDITLKFINALLKNKHYTVVERTKMEPILDEQKLSLSGLINDEQRIEIGKMLGVDAFIVGSGNYSVIDNGGWYKHTYKDKNGKQKVYHTYKINRKVDVTLSYRVVSVENGQILASKEINSANYDESKIFLAQMYQDYVEKADAETARLNVPDWKPIVNRLTNKIIKKAVHQIAPHYKNEKKEIKNGSTPAMKAGFQYAKRKLWDDAKESWEFVLTDYSANGQKDKIHAMYNLGIYYEIHSDLEKAEELFNQCFKMSGKSKYLDARKRIQKRKKELNRLKNQLTTS